MTETVTQLVSAYGPKQPQLADLDPDSPQAYAYARALGTALVKDCEAQWWKDRTRTLQGGCMRACMHACVPALCASVLPWLCRGVVPRGEGCAGVPTLGHTHALPALVGREPVSLCMYVRKVCSHIHA